MSISKFSIPALDTVQAPQVTPRRSFLDYSDYRILILLQYKQ